MTTEQRVECRFVPLLGETLQEFPVRGPGIALPPDQLLDLSPVNAGSQFCHRGSRYRARESLRSTNLIPAEARSANPEYTRDENRGCTSSESIENSCGRPISRCGKQ